METQILYFSYVIGALTLVTHIGIAFFIVAFILQKKVGWARTFIAFCGENAFLYGFIVAFVGVVGSLVYSNVLGLPPCELCWWQRVFLYPQVIMLGVASMWKSAHTAFYALIFSFIGMMIGAYQVLLQRVPIESAFCSVENGAIDCSEVYFEVIGYITLPVMSTTVFAIIALLALAYLGHIQDPWYVRIMKLLRLHS